MFDNAKNQWSRWVKRLEGAFTIFNVPDDKKVGYLLHYMGADAFDTLCDKLAPEDPWLKEYKFLVDYMQQYYNPAPLEIAENFRFNKRRQQEGVFAITIDREPNNDHDVSQIPRSSNQFENIDLSDNVSSNVKPREDYENPVVVQNKDINIDSNVNLPSCVVDSSRNVISEPCTMTQDVPTLRRSTRIRKTPNRLDL
ncbi:hypothetical protein QE152_g32632 [Popillia japonica]|uniref:Uncharacterized protein n=1 Tax=Popillia japonica TaxID=7064 RepID=A0AAW1IZ71_POPJA